MSDEREYELKFTIAPADLGQLMNHPALSGGATQAQPARMLATYFDTPDRDLWERGISLRIRERDGVKLQTIKRLGSSYIDREEIEFEVPDMVPSMAGVGDPALVALLDHPNIALRLAGAFTIEVERTTVPILVGGSEIEAAIDRGEIRSGDRRLDISELELELKHGTATDLFGLASSLVNDSPLVPSLISKAERGVRLLDGSWGHPVKRRSTPLRKGMEASVAFKAIGEACLHDLMLNVVAMMATDDIEGVHQARVALRRLRAAIALFKPVIQDEVLERLTPELKWMWGLLGDARDLDVLQSEVFEPAAQNDAVLGGDALAGHMRARQQEARAALAEALASRRWRVALNDFIAWLLDGPWLHDESRREVLHKIVVPRLRKRRRAVVKAAKRLRHLLPDERHALRIAAKKLRYAMEFFEDTKTIGRGSKPYRKLQQGLEDLQEPLGLLHDQEARQALLRAETETLPVPGSQEDERAAFAAGLLAGSVKDGETWLDEAVDAGRDVADNDPF